MTPVSRARVPRDPERYAWEFWWGGRLLHDDGRSLLDEPFERRRTRMEALALNGPRWQTAPSWPGEVHAVRRAAAEQGLPGVVGKRLDSAYAPGEESAAWVRLPGKGDGAG